MEHSVQDACPIPQPRLPLTAVTPELEPQLARGGDPRFVRTMGHVPDAYLAWSAFYGKLIYAGVLPTRIKEAARLRIAALNGCHY
jgi:alkylhydroperoxidase family enzyme